MSPVSHLQTTLSNCNVVDLQSVTIEEKVSIAISGNSIRKIANATERAAGPVIDMNASYVMPGLVNLHNNLSMVFPFKNTDLNEREADTVLRCHRRAYDALMTGVTTIRTVGEMHRVDFSLRKMINDGWVRGPRIFAGGKALGTPGGHGSGFGQVETKGPENFYTAAMNELNLGADHLKIFITGGIAKREEAFEESQMTNEEISAVVSAARTKGTYVAAHSGGSKPIMDAAEAGVRSFEHAYVLSREAAKLLKKKNACVVPTLSVTRSPKWMRENGFEEWTVEKAISAGDTHLQSIKNAVEEGVRILNGTDMPAGDLNDGVNATVKELEFLMDAGLNTIEALRASTTYCAELLGVPDRLGLAKEGYFADLIAMTSNPLSDIKSMRKIKFVMKNGEVIRNELRD